MGDILVASSSSEHLRSQIAAVERAARAMVLTWLAAEDGVPRSVSPAQLRALMVVRRRGRLNLSQLAEELGTIPSWASRLCDRLEAESLLERRPADRGRHVVITLREAGERLLADLSERRVEALAAVMAGMSPGERRALQAGLEAFSRAATPEVEAVGRTA